MANRLINLLRGRTAVSCGTRSLAYLVARSRSLCSILLAFSPLATAFRSTLICGVLSCMLLGAEVGAQELTDPTRPAANLDVIESSSGSAGQVVQPDDTQGLRLIIIQKKRRAAIINGRTVELGGKTGDARLVEVNEGSVVLQGAQGRQVLTLFPNVKTNRQPLPTNIKTSGKDKIMPVANKEEK